ncbi:MAG TPA: DUF507 family protein [Bdellovibrionota bacterium]|nr:DUF507 family protein [Bdellovibrionota bacterium]
MRLRPEEVERIVDRLLSEWKSQHLATFTAPESQIRTRLLEIFLADLRVEDDLNKEVDQMLHKYEKEFARGTLDRHKMFQMVKNQLIKERKMVL